MERGSRADGVFAQFGPHLVLLSALTVASIATAGTPVPPPTSPEDEITGTVRVATTSPEGPAAAQSSGIFPHCTQASAINAPIRVNFAVTDSGLGMRMPECDVGIACVDIGTNQNIFSVNVTLTLEDVPLSGGHDHDDGMRPEGVLTSLTGTTGTTDGIFHTTYFSPQVSGLARMTIDCQHPLFNFGPPEELFFEISDTRRFDPLPKTAAYDLVGTTSQIGKRHLSNHHGTRETLAGIHRVAFLYRSMYPGERLAINDMSLEWGGVFDLGPDANCYDIPSQTKVPGADWERCHGAHRYGTSVDVEDVAPARIKVLERFAKAAGFTKFLDETNHYHLER